MVRYRTYTIRCNNTKLQHNSQLNAGDPVAMLQGVTLMYARLQRTEQPWPYTDKPDQAKSPRKLCNRRAFILHKTIHMQNEKI